MSDRLLIGVINDQLKNVTIGIPVFNDENHIEETVRSAADQCGRLIISDNCSTDSTFIICKKLIHEFSNIELIEQKENIGALNNFIFLLDHAQSEYFMWLGSHDILDKNYVTTLVNRLTKEPNATLAYATPVNIDKHGAKISEYSYFFSDELASHSAADRVYSIIKNLYDCSLIHGVFRLDKLKPCWIHADYIGGDHVLLANLAMAGKFIYEKNIKYFRRYVHENDSKSAQLRRIVGESDKSDVSYDQMQIGQFEIAKKVSIQKSIPLFFVIKSYFWIVKRFGVFDQKNNLFMDKILFKCSIYYVYFINRFFR